MKEYRGKIPFLLKEIGGKILYLCSSDRNIEDYYNVLSDIYSGNILKLENTQSKDELEKDNYDLLEILKSEEDFIILLSLEAILREYFLEGKRYEIEIGKSLDIKELENSLEESGYNKEYMVEERNQYSMRGDILDIFPKNSKYPVRIEFSFNNEVERIAYFDIETQKSVEKKNQVYMYINNNIEEKNSFLDFLNNRNDLKIFIENIDLLNYKLEEILSNSEIKEKSIKGIYNNFLKIAKSVEINKFTHEELQNFESIEYIKKIGKDPLQKIKIVSDEEKRYREIFEGYNFEYEKYPLFEGYKEENLLVLTDRELKGIRVRREKKDKGFQRYKNITEIQEGNYIIHENYGVGLYLGIEIIDGHDYLKIKYAGEDKLFVPIEGIGKIGKYISIDGEIPEIYNLGRKGFRKKREKIAEEMLQFAKEIVEIQARRDLEAGYSFAPDNLWQEEFEESFPYKETPSQLQAIEDVKRDMESSRIMDRVVCGDVGYGKTEVAIRAAFKAAIEGKQVVLMVPTTVLAQQHYERFTERMKNYPINIELLSRLLTSKEQTQTLKKIKEGGVDYSNRYS